MPSVLSCPLHQFLRAFPSSPFLATARHQGVLEMRQNKPSVCLARPSARQSSNEVTLGKGPILPLAHICRAKWAHPLMQHRCQQNMHCSISMHVYGGGDGTYHTLFSGHTRSLRKWGTKGEAQCGSLRFVLGLLGAPGNSFQSPSVQYCARAECQSALYSPAPHLPMAREWYCSYQGSRSQGIHGATQV